MKSPQQFANQYNAHVVVNPDGSYSDRNEYGRAVRFSFKRFADAERHANRRGGRVVSPSHFECPHCLGTKIEEDGDSFVRCRCQEKSVKVS